MRRALFAERALLPTGWARDVRVELGGDGRIEAVSPGAAIDGAEYCGGTLVPGMPNLHSHAFQRAMAGLAERAGTGGQADSFWTWRSLMYGFVARLTPERVRDVAAQLQVECLKAGYTAIAEFHYLHNDMDGAPYADAAAMGRAVLEARAQSGIAVTHLPVLYMRGGFDGRALAGGQLRFRGTPDSIAGMLDALKGEACAEVRLGVALHSLRAVPKDAMRDMLALADARDPACPVHIHVAEQPLEVEDCLAATGARPVEWLLREMPVDGRWCLVHATHMTAEETRALAATGAVAGLCPSTEGNLGDGLFPLEAYLKAGGRFGVGSDSHVSVDPREELRWLDYGQRLVTGRRSMDLGARHVGAHLWRAAVEGGCRALGRDAGRIAPGARADLLVLDEMHPALWGREDDRILDALVFAGLSSPVRHTMVGGRWVVRDGHHPAEEAVAARFRKVVTELLDA